MKRILFFIFALASILYANAQTSESEEDYSTYELVCKSDLGKDQLWSNLKKYVATKFVSYKHTVDMEDKDGGTMIIKFNIHNDTESVYTASDISAVIQVDVKDQKFRIRVSDPIFTLSPNSKCDDLYLMPSAILQKAKTELEAAESLSGDEIKSYNDLKATINVYKQLMETTPKYRKPKDEKKGKVNELYQKYEKVVKLGDGLITSYRYNSVMITSNIKEAMKTTNDF